MGDRGAKHSVGTWEHPSIGTYRLAKRSEGGYRLWRYDFGGWVFVRVLTEQKLDKHYLGEDTEYTYWS